MKKYFLYFLFAFSSCQVKKQPLNQVDFNPNLWFSNEKIILSVQQYITEHKPEHPICLYHFPVRYYSDTNFIKITQSHKIPQNYIFKFKVDTNTIYVRSSLEDILINKRIKENNESVIFCPPEWLIEMKDSTFFTLKKIIDRDFSHNHGRIPFLTIQFLPPKKGMKK